jgi:very-short-patch-repair endonuclease
VNRELRRFGWRVLRIWEHDIPRPVRCLPKLRRALAQPRNPSPQPRPSTDTP